ncbi:MAG: TonB-dependent receptor [Gemmatimonadota bacterium]
MFQKIPDLRLDQRLENDQLRERICLHEDPEVGGDSGLKVSAVSRRVKVALRSVWVASFLLLPTPVAAQQQEPGRLSGVVLDAAGEGIVDAAVSLRITITGESPRIVLTDGAGEFEFGTIPAGVYIVRVQRLGYAPEERSLSLAPGEVARLELVLRTVALRLEGVVAEAAPDRERERFEQDAGVTAHVIEARTLGLLPGLAEPDVMRAVQLLPGVISTSDFSSSFNVRGGSADQNLILLDGFTVFNPFHLGGLFSVFNSDAVERAELFAGGFGAEFGGRVSSVLNIESRRDVPDGVEIRGGVSMLASRVLLHAPLPVRLGTALGGDGGSAFLSFRRSYFDQLLRPIADFPYHLADLQAHAGIGTPNGGRLSATAYAGRDVLDLSGFGLADSGEASDVLRLTWDWGNRLIGLHLEQPLPGDWSVDTRVGFSRFAESLEFLDFGDVRFESRIEQLVWRGDLTRTYSPGLALQVGASAERLSYANFAAGGGTTFLDLPGSGALAGAYAALRARPGSRWLLEPGVRLDVWSAGTGRRTVIAPRFALKRFFGARGDLAVKLALGRYSQFLHSLRDEELPVSNDTWVVSDAAVPPVISDQVQLGVESFWDAGWSASAEIYARDFDGVTEFNLAQNPNIASDDLLAGEGTARGLDLELRKAQGRFTGWVALSLLRASRELPDPLADEWNDLPPTISYAPVFDRRVNFDLVLQYTTERALEVGGRWNYGSGLPYTRPVAQHFAWRHGPITGLAEPSQQGFERDGVPLGVVLGPRNTERYPAYHRLDLTVRRTFERSWGSFVPYLQVLNVYDRRNVLFYFYDYDRTPPVRSGFSMFPFLPAIGVEVAF